MKTFLLFYAICATRAWRSNGDGFPNPIYNKEECNRHKGVPSFICDPNNILTLDISDKIEHIINEIQNDYRIGVAVFDKLDVRGTDNNPMKTFTTAIHRDWMFTENKYNSSIIFALSIMDKDFYYSIGSDLLKIIKSDLNKMQNIHNLVERELWIDASVQAVKNIRTLLEPTSLQQTTPNILIIVLIYVGIGFVVIILVCILYTSGEIMLTNRRIQREIADFAGNRDTIVKCYRRNQINRVCIICFDDDNTTLYFEQKCNHYYHAHCIDEFNIMRCPICVKTQKINKPNTVPEIYARYDFLRKIYPLCMTKYDVLLYSSSNYLNSNKQFPEHCSIISKITPF